MVKRIKDVISAKNQTLFQSVIKKNEIRLAYDADLQTWGSKFEKKVGYIYQVETIHPEESFVHELLHLECQQNGYIRPTYCIDSLSEENTYYLFSLVEAIDNELQHILFYSRYISMGYDATKFYHDDDAIETPKFINNELTNILIPGKTKNIIYIMTKYITLLAPGADLIFPNLNNVKQDFKNLNIPNINSILTDFENIMKKWENGYFTDSRECVKEILKLIPNTNLYICFDHQKKPSKNGFFLNQPFDFSIKANGDIEII